MSARLRTGRALAAPLLISLLIAGLVALGSFGWLALAQLRGTLIENAHARLEDTGRSTAQALLDRLVAADAVLGYSGTRAAQEPPAAFDALVLVTDEGSRALLGEWDAPRDVGVGPPDSKLIVRRETGVPEVLLAKAMTDGIVVGRIDPSYLWAFEELMPSGTDACVYANPRRVPLFCTSRAAFEGSAPAAAADPDRQAERLASEQALRLDRLGAASWSVAVSQPRSVALGSLGALNLVVVLALGLCGTLALLVAIVHSKLALKPMGRFVAAARRIAGKDLSEPFAWHKNDAFGALGHAMSEIAASVGRQHDTLAAFAEIDRLILSSRDTRHVLDAVIDRIAQVVPNCDIGVLLLGQADRGRFYCRTEAGQPSNGLVRTPVSKELRKWLLRQPHGGLHDAGEIRSRLTQYPLDARASRVFVMPIIHGEDLQGALFACFDTGVDVPAPQLDSLREFASRCAVAISVAEREQKLIHRAYFDALTGLPNRTLCHDRLRQALSVARREEHKLAVVFIDLDGFKHVNDSLGHSSGDELLRQAALRLRAALRETDTVARLGGDEYVVILSQIQGTLEAQVIAENIMEVLEAPFLIQGQLASVSASLGITVFPDDALTVEDLLRKADMAMYEAKDHGRERCVFFAEEMDRRAHERLTLHTDLRSALANRELFLVYQPQVELATGRVICAEALLRWKHPTRGFVPVASFLPVLEETGLVESIGRWVLQTALADFERWKRQGLGVERVAVNIATRQLFDNGLVYLVDESLHRSNLSGACLEVELTESSLVRDFERTNRVLKSLSERNVRIAIDDFGTGYSSLEYLKDLTFDVVKIDRAFISAMHDEKSMAIIKAVMGLAHSMDKKVVAEGIESELQRRQLVNLKCDIGQGFLLGRPMAESTFAQWLGSLEATFLLEEAFEMRA